MWGAAWLRRATQSDTYMNYIQENRQTLGADDNINEFGWDNKHAGLNVLVSKVSFIHSYNTLLPTFINYLVKFSSRVTLYYYFENKDKSRL